MNPSIQLSVVVTKSASMTAMITTTWITCTFLSHVIPNLPLCFSNYARSGTKYDVGPLNLIVQA